VLHLHHGVTAIRAVPEARRAGVRHVCMTEHSTLQLDSEHGYRGKTRRVMPLIDSVTVLNEDMREFFVRSLPESRSRLSLVPNAANPRFLLLRRDPATDGRVTVGFLGRLEPVKDVATLLRAIAIVHRRGAAHVDLRLAGDGSQRQELESLAASLGIARDVRFLGAVPDAAALYAASDVFALPSVSEGTPLVLMEAMSAALPCVATTVGGVPELIEGVGVLVPPSNADAMAGGLLRLVEDESLRQTLGRQARARIEAEYSIDAMLDRYLAVFGLPPYWSPRVRRPRADAQAREPRHRELG
jgi:glycosyltransferase involved in cell wall biosynthesis